MGKTSFTFKSSERLKKRKYIEALFSSGKALSHFPFRAVYTISPASEHPDSESPILFGISVPKRKHKTAIARNLLKRRSREAWRLNKSQLMLKFQTSGQVLHIFFLYQTSKVLCFDTIEAAIKNIISQLEKIPLQEGTSL